MIGLEQQSPPLEYIEKIKWKQKPNNPVYTKYNDNPEEVEQLTLDIAVSPNDSKKLTIIYPGLNEGLNGFVDRRYRQISSLLQTHGISAVVRSGNPFLEKFMLTTNLWKMTNYALKNAKKISGSDTPEIYMMGYSAGASAVAAMASLNEQISKILLISPSGDAPKETVTSSLSKFKGEVTIVIGENDEIVGKLLGGKRVGQIFYNLASSASCRNLIVIPDCGHYFDTPENNNLFIQAPLKAFS